MKLATASTAPDLRAPLRDGWITRRPKTSARTAEDIGSFPEWASVMPEACRFGEQKQADMSGLATARRPRMLRGAAGSPRSRLSRAVIAPMISLWLWTAHFPLIRRSQPPKSTL